MEKIYTMETCCSREQLKDYDINKMYVDITEQASPVNSEFFKDAVTLIASMEQ